MTTRHPTRPCACCPYRMDAPREHWDREHFEDTLRARHADGLGGSVFACHTHADKPPSERGWCAGWALDQKANNTPSIPLRMILMTNTDGALDSWKALNGNGLTLFPDVESMCEANGVEVQPRRRLRIIDSFGEE